MNPEPVGDKPAERTQGMVREPRTRSVPPFLYVLVTFVAFRLMAVLLVKPGGYITTVSDFTFYRLLASYASQGFFPSVHYWMEYQPLFPWIPVGIYRLSLLLPNWGEPGFWFNFLLGTFFMLSETANLVLIYFIGRRLYREEIALRIAWIYSLLFVPLLIMLGWFDVFGLTFLLLALYLTLLRRPAWIGLVAGLGFLVKLLPIIVIPVAFWREPTCGVPLLRWRRRAILVGVTVLTIVALALPFGLLNPKLFALSWTINLKRSSWETVWALLEGYTSFGLAGGANRFDPTDAGALQHPSTLPWPLITAGFAVMYVALWIAASRNHSAPLRNGDESPWPPAACPVPSVPAPTLSVPDTAKEAVLRMHRGDRDRQATSERLAARRAVAFTGLTMNLVTLYLKGYSPQFLVWLLPFVILLLPGMRGVVYAVLLSTINLIESPLYFTILPDQSWLLAGAVLARSGLLILLSVEYGRMAVSQPISTRWSRRLCLGAAAVILVLGLVAVPFAYDAYYKTRLVTNPYRPAVEMLHGEAMPGARVVIGDQSAFDATYAFLQRRFDVTSVQTDWWYPDWQPRLARAVQGHAQTWVYAPAESPLHTWMAGRYTPLTSKEFDGWQLSGWDTR